jgi:acetylornithine/succinyldiaminopimelate/putrescine aminotransferase
MRAEVTVAQQAIVKQLKELVKQHGLSLSIDEYRPNKHQGNKEERIASTLEPRYDNLQMWHYRGGNIQTLEEELMSRNPPHDDIKDALASAVDIAVKPSRSINKSKKSNIVWANNRFRGTG